MRLLHTSDWHLGRLLHEASLLEEQAHALDQIVTMARDAKPDLVVIAGDIYDRALPPAEAVDLLDDVLTRLVMEAQVRVLLIPGNHDSAQRLNFGSRLLRAQGVTLAGRLFDVTHPLKVSDAHGEVDVYSVPYVEPAEVRAWLGDEAIRGHDQAWRAVLAKMAPSISRRNVLVAHAFVAGGLDGESERPLSIGGSSAVAAEAFAGYQYVALGHLHRPQQIGDGPLWYSGSLCKYAFSEAPHQKGALLVDMDATGAIQVERLPFSQKRNVRRIEGRLEELLKPPISEVNRDDYIEAVLLDEAPQLHAMERLRGLYPNVLHIHRPNLLRVLDDKVGLRGDHRRFGDMDLFQEFLRQVHQRELTSEEGEAFARVVSALDKAGQK